MAAMMVGVALGLVWGAVVTIEGLLIGLAQLRGTPGARPFSAKAMFGLFVGPPVGSAALAPLLGPELLTALFITAAIVVAPALVVAGFGVATVFLQEFFKHHVAPIPETPEVIVRRHRLYVALVVALLPVVALVQRLWPGLLPVSVASISDYGLLLLMAAVPLIAILAGGSARA